MSEQTVYKVLLVWLEQPKRIRVVFDRDLHQPSRNLGLGKYSDVRLRSVKAYKDALVEYVPGEWACAPGWLAEHGYHLTAFETLSHACDFIGGQQMAQRAVVFEATARGVTTPPPMLSYGTVSEGHVHEHVPREYVRQWPAGTVMARQLRLERPAWSLYSVPALAIPRLGATIGAFPVTWKG